MMALRSGIAIRGKLSATDYDRLASIADEYRRILRTHILPAIGSKRIVDVRRDDVARLHAGLVRTPYEDRTLAAVVRPLELGGEA
jgi:hypothetical protein